MKIEDTVSYKNLTPGKEYTVKGVLMNKATGEPLLADTKEIRSSFTFKPDKPDGEINITFIFDASGLKTATEIVVFETLYRDDTEIAAHADLKDEGQTVKSRRPHRTIRRREITPTSASGSDSALWRSAVLWRLSLSV